MINSQDIKKGTCVRMDGKLYFCIDFLHRKPGKGNTNMNVTLKDVVNGGVLERRFNIGEKLEDVRVERRPYQYLYKDGDDLVFMNNETFEQISISPSQVNGVNFLKESENVEVVVDENRINSVSLVNLDESVATMYPLMQPALDAISQQIYENQSLEGIDYGSENQYTSQLLVEAIRNALSKAEEK